MQNELIKQEVESIEGEHLTQNEYQADRVMKIHQERMRKVAERERVKRQHEREMDLAAVQIRLQHSIDFANAWGGVSQSKPETTTYCKGFDKAMMFIFLAFAAVILKLAGV